MVSLTLMHEDTDKPKILDYVAKRRTYNNIQLKSGILLIYVDPIEEFTARVVGYLPRARTRGSYISLPNYTLLPVRGSENPYYKISTCQFNR
jgi:hypothetical protein